MSPIPSALVFEGNIHKVIAATASHRLLRLTLSCMSRRNSKVFVFICVYLSRPLRRLLPEVDRHRPILPGTFWPALDMLQSKVPFAPPPTGLATMIDTRVPADRSS